MKSGERLAREAKGSTNYKRTKMKRQIRVIINGRNKGAESKVSIKTVYREQCETRRVSVNNVRVKEERRT